MSRANPDALDMVVRHDRKLRRLPRHGAGGGPTPGPWIDLMDYIDTTYWIPGTANPYVRLWGDWAECRGRIVAIDDLPGDGLLATALPAGYRPPELADVFIPVDDDASMDLQPPRGGWTVDVLVNGFINFDAVEVVLDRTTASPTLKYVTALIGNHGRPAAGCALTFEGVRWAVGAP